MAALARVAVSARAANGWGPTAWAPPRTRLASPLRLQFDEVAADRHGADVEGVGGVGDRHGTVVVQPGDEPVEPLLGGE